MSWAIHWGNLRAPTCDLTGIPGGPHSIEVGNTPVVSLAIKQGVTIRVLMHADFYDLAQEDRVGSRFNNFTGPADHAGASFLEHRRTGIRFRPHGATCCEALIPVGNPGLAGEYLGNDPLMFVEDIDGKTLSVRDQIVG